MKFITDDILKTLSEQEYTISDVTIRRASQANSKVKDKLVTVQEFPSSSGVKLFNSESNEPKIEQTIISVEIYAQQGIVDGKPTTGEEIAFSILNEVNRVLQDCYNLKMTGAISSNPYPTDNSYWRCVARYVVYIDTRNTETQYWTSI